MIILKQDERTIIHQKTILNNIKFSIQRKDRNPSCAPSLAKMYSYNRPGLSPDQAPGNGFSKKRQPLAFTVMAGAGFLLFLLSPSVALADPTALFNDYSDNECVQIRDPATTEQVTGNPTCALRLGNAGNPTPLGLSNGINLVSNGNGLFLRNGLEVFGVDAAAAGAPVAHIHGVLSLFKNSVTLSGPNKLIGLAPGTLSATSTDGVNGAQLNATNRQVTLNTTAINTINEGGGVKYFHSNSTLADSRAVGPDSVAIGPGATANNPRDVALGAGSTTSPVVATPSMTIQGRTFNLAGGAPTSTVSLGAPGSERTLTNLAAGRVSADSTDAVNGSQLHATNQAIASVTQLAGNFVRYDRGKTSLSLGGPDAFTPVRISNVAKGELSPTSTTAVNGSQLHQTNEEVARLDNAAIKYDTNANGGKANSITLNGGDPNTPVVIRKVAAGTEDTDAVNVSQLKQAQTNVNNYIDQRVQETVNTTIVNYTNQVSEQTLQAANAYTDQQFNQLHRDIRQSRSEARQAAAIGLAAASLRYDDRPGKISMAIGGGFWRGENALAMGLGFTSEDNSFRGSVSTATSDGEWGVGAGLSFTLN